jgi:hypothetical protein
MHTYNSPKYIHTYKGVKLSEIYPTAWLGASMYPSLNDQVSSSVMAYMTYALLEGPREGACGPKPRVRKPGRPTVETGETRGGPAPSTHLSISIFLFDCLPWALSGFGALRECRQEGPEQPEQIELFGLYLSPRFYSERYRCEC